MTPTGVSPTHTLACALALALTGCAHGDARGPTTPAPRPTEPSASAPPPLPTLVVGLAEPGATLSLDEGADGCVPLPPRPAAGEPTEPLEVCPGAPLTVTLDRLGGVTFQDGWVWPVAALPDARVELGEGVQTLGSGDAALHFVGGPHTRPLGDLGYVHLGPPPDEASAQVMPSADERLAAYERAAEALREWLGPPRRPIFVLDAVDADPGRAGVRRSLYEPPTVALLRAWVAPGADWWERGLSAYLALLAAHEGGALPEEGAYDELMERYRRQRERPGESPATARGDAAGDVGILVAYCADVELRRQGSSLLDQLRAAGEGPFEADRLEAQLAQDHPAVARRLRARVGRRGVLELDQCLRAAGRKLVAHEVPIIDPARLIRVDDLDERSARVTARGRGPLQEGDVIRHIRGRAVRRAWDIVFFLRDLEGRHRFSVSVQRGERTVRAWLRMVAIGDELPTRIRFTAEENPEEEDRADPFRGPVDERQ